MPHIVILNGPNLNMLGTREPAIYGRQTLQDIARLCEQWATSLALKVSFRQTNHEGELVGWVQEAGNSNAADGLILNPGAYGHTSIALMDALLDSKIPAVEVHLSNIYKREEFRRHTYSSSAVRGIISGFGSFGYVMAMYALSDIFKQNPTS